MPKYNYKCFACNKEFEVRHSMTESIESCTFCQEKNVKKIPSLNFSVGKASSAGKLVKEYIEDTKRQVSDEKDKLKREYHD